MLNNDIKFRDRLVIENITKNKRTEVFVDLTDAYEKSEEYVYIKCTDVFTRKELDNFLNMSLDDTLDFIEKRLEKVNYRSIFDYVITSSGSKAADAK